jgi:hypothetical protein
MIAYIDANKGRFGFEPIIQLLPIAPSTYYAARRRPPSARRCRDQELKVQIARVHGEHFGVYGARKVWRPVLDLSQQHWVLSVDQHNPFWALRIIRVPGRQHPVCQIVGRHRAVAWNAAGHLCPHSGQVAWLGPQDGISLTAALSAADPPWSDDAAGFGYSGKGSGHRRVDGLRA